MSLKTFALPPDNRTVGSGDPPADVDDLVDAAAAMGAGRNVLNTTFGGGADPTGAADSTVALTAAAAALGGQLMYLPAGTYLMNAASAIALTTAGSGIMGDLFGATVIKIGGSFSASEVINIDAGNCSVTGISIIGASSTISSNPAANGIEVQPGSYQTTIQNFFGQYINGYGIEASNLAGHSAISHSFYDKIAIYNCAGGMHFNGAQMTVGTVLSNIEIGNIGTGSGANANLDALLIEDAFDITGTNVNVGTGNAGTGHGLRIHGNCQNIWFDVGHGQRGGIDGLGSVRADTGCGLNRLRHPGPRRVCRRGQQRQVGGLRACPPEHGRGPDLIAAAGHLVRGDRHRHRGAAE